MALNPRYSGEHIVANAKSLKVKPEGIVRLTEEVIFCSFITTLHRLS